MNSTFYVPNPDVIGRILDRMLNEMLSQKFNTTVYTVTDKGETPMTITHEFTITDTQDDRHAVQKVMEKMVANVHSSLKQLDKFTAGAEVAATVAAHGYTGDTSPTGNALSKMFSDRACVYDANKAVYAQPTVHVASHKMTVEHAGIKATVRTPAAIEEFANALIWGSYSYLKA